MPAPTVATYAVDAIIAAHQSLIDLIDGGATAGKIIVRNSADGILAQIPLADPCGTINGTTGQLTFDIDDPDLSADASGTAAYVEFADSDSTVYLQVPAVTGTTPIAGKVVFNTLNVVEGYPVTMLSFTAG